MTTILIEKNMMVPMRDGVRLATDIYRLEGADPSPVLVVRTPYNKDGLVAGGDTFDILRAVQVGYTVVAQDVRGRYASEGTFTPHIQETDDGLDAFAWAAAQPWSKGAATSHASIATATRAGISRAKLPININRRSIASSMTRRIRLV